MTKCSKCDAESTYDSPGPMCDQHWGEWWVNGLLEGSDATPEAREALLEETMTTLTALEMEATKPHTVNRALVVFAYGEGQVLLWTGDEGVHAYLDAMGCDQDTPTLDELSADYKAPNTPGVYVCDITFVDDGPGDWPGTRETVISFKNFRPVSDKEWRAHLNSEYPWDPFETPDNAINVVDGRLEIPTRRN